MDNMLRNDYTNKYFSISDYGIILITFIHLLGYLDLREWFIFSGTGAEAEKIDEQYGYIGLALLNGIALVMFTLMAVIYNHRNNRKLFLYTSYGIILVFLLRGLGGYILIVIGEIGTATPIWELVFSTLAVTIGISGILEVKEQ